MWNSSKNVRLFVTWGVLCVIVNVLCTYASAYDGDQSFWVGWVQQLMDHGFGGFKGNYPPLYVFWLWVVAQVHSIFGIVVGKTFFLKFICLWPVYFSHLFLVDWFSRFVSRFNYPDWKRHIIMGLVALNPALLMAGPVWGQVDLFPIVFAVLGIYCMFKPNKVLLASMFYVLALLAKFQMILFLPVFGGLFLKHWRHSWKGLPIALGAIVLVLLPFAITGNLTGMLSRAYVQTTSQYPYATYNAANLWYLIAGNVAPDNVPVFHISEYGLGFIFKPAILGKVLFILISIFSLIKTIRSTRMDTVWSLATLNALAFFVVLPGMHERYLLYAVPVSLCWCVWNMNKGTIWCVLISLAAALNVAFINPLSGYFTWNMTSAFTCVILVLCLFTLAFPDHGKRLWNFVWEHRIPCFVPYVLLSVMLVIVFVVNIYMMRPISVPKTNNMVFLTDMTIEKFEQEYKSPRENNSVEGNLLQAGYRVYRNGIGTHANSKIIYKLPERADSLYFGVAIDDETYGKGDAEFAVYLDNELVWKSKALRGFEKPVFMSLSVKNKSVLELRTSSRGSNSSDHTDWLNPYIKLF